MITKATKRIILSAAIIGLSISSSSAQLIVDATPTPTFLVTNVLLGTGVTASGITYTGNPLARGSFNGVGSNIGFASGVMLATGNINTAIGPNNSGSAGTDLDANDADPDLDAISANDTYDGAILEFDFVALSDTLKFRYVFASEEYMEFVNAGVNDAFGFFISGPGISGPYSGGSQNIALIPGTSTPVTIDNVNGAATPALYVDNETPPGATVQYDGFTVPLTAISPVQCGETYHIKIAIADAGDGVWDSGVFLEAGSFSSVGVNIIPEISYGGANDSTLYEGCGNACIYFVRTSNLSVSDTIDVTISGTATNGTDYYDNSVGVGALLPSQLIFAPGQDSISYCINAVSDPTTEGMESIILNIQPQGSALCVPPPTTATIFLDEYSPLAITVADTALCNHTGSYIINSTVTGGVEPFTYSWTGGLPPVADPAAMVPPGTTSYIVTVSDACTGSPDPTPAISDTATIQVANIAVITYSLANDTAMTEGCGSKCFTYTRTSNLLVSDTLNITIGGTAVNGVDYYNNATGPGTLIPTQLIFAPSQTSLSFCINTTVDGVSEGMESIVLNSQPTGVSFCMPPPATASIHIHETTPIVLTLTGDTTLCNLGGTVTLNSTVTGGVQPYTYTWTGGLSSIADPTVTVTTTTSYTLTVNDACTGSPTDPTPVVSDVATITVSTFDPMVVSAGSDVTVCPGDVVNLSGTVTGGGSPYFYNWSTVIGTDTVASPNAINTLLMGNENGVYMLSVIDICGNTESDQIAVIVEPSCALNIPNVITPDGEGPMMNETFHVDNLDKFPNSTLAIYNRWGNKIYENSNYQNNWNGSKYPDGTYYYILTVPPSGQIMASLKKDPKYDYEVTTEMAGDNKVFAGFFQIIRLK